MGLRIPDKRNQEVEKLRSFFSMAKHNEENVKVIFSLLFGFIFFTFRRVGQKRRRSAWQSARCRSDWPELKAIIINEQFYFAVATAALASCYINRLAFVLFES